MAAPEVCVLIATLGQAELLEPSLAEVRRQADEIGAELLVVVNTAEATADPARLAGWRRLAHRLLFEPRPGKSHALNRGLAATEAAIVAFGDDDALPYRGWLRRITEPLRCAEDGVVGTGGRVIPVYPAGGPPAWYRRLVAGKRSSFLGPLHDLGPEPADYPADGNTSILPFGANCAYLREALLPEAYDPRLGPSPETGLRGGEDTAVAIRIQGRGGRLRWVPEAVVHHPVTPGRMELDFVRRGHHLQGVEAVRFLQVLGLPTRGLADSRRRLRRHRRRCRLARWLRPRRLLREQLRCLFYQGVVEELERHGGRA